MASHGPLAVTGASGFVGRRIVARALADGWRVRAFARRLDSLGDFAHPALTLHPWDIESPLAAADLRGASALLHLAAFVPPDLTDSRFAEACFRINAVGALAVGRAAMEAGIPRFVHFSSGQVYSPRQAPAVEEDATFPAARAPYYLSSKLSAEIFVEHLRLQHGLPAATLRVASVYGPAMKGGLVATLARRAAQGLAIELTGGGRYSVDFVHVDDVAEAALMAARSQAPGIFNVGSGVATTSLEAARIIVEVLGADPGLIRILPPEGRADEQGFPPLAIGKAKAAFSYAPMSFAEGVRKWLSESPPERR